MTKKEMRDKDLFQHFEKQAECLTKIKVTLEGVKKDTEYLKDNVHDFRDSCKCTRDQYDNRLNNIEDTITQGATVLKILPYLATITSIAAFFFALT